MKLEKQLFSVLGSLVSGRFFIATAMMFLSAGIVEGAFFRGAGRLGGQALRQLGKGAAEETLVVGSRARPQVPLPTGGPRPSGGLSLSSPQARPSVPVIPKQPSSSPSLFPGLPSLLSGSRQVFSPQVRTSAAISPFLRTPTILESALSKEQSGVGWGAFSENPSPIVGQTTPGSLSSILSEIDKKGLNLFEEVPKESRLDDAELELPESKKSNGEKNDVIQTISEKHVSERSLEEELGKGIVERPSERVREERLTEEQQMRARQEQEEAESRFKQEQEAAAKRAEEDVAARRRAEEEQVREREEAARSEREAEERAAQARQEEAAAVRRAEEARARQEQERLEREQRLREEEQLQLRRERERLEREREARERERLEREREEEAAAARRRAEEQQRERVREEQVRAEQQRAREEQQRARLREEEEAAAARRRTEEQQRERVREEQARAEQQRVREEQQRARLREEEEAAVARRRAEEQQREAALRLQRSARIPVAWAGQGLAELSAAGRLLDLSMPSLPFMQEQFQPAVSLADFYRPIILQTMSQNRFIDQKIITDFHAVAYDSRQITMEYIAEMLALYNNQLAHFFKASDKMIANVTKKTIFDMLARIKSTIYEALHLQPLALDGVSW